MKIEVEAVSPVEKKVTVEVDPERVAEELDRAYEVVGKRVKLKGFRPGKVPRKVLERHFKDEVERDVVQKLNAALTQVLAQVAVKERFATLGAEVHPSTSDELGAWIREDLAVWMKVVKQAGIKLEL